MQTLLTTDSPAIFDVDVDHSLPVVPQREHAHTVGFSQAGPMPTVVRKGLEVLDAAYGAMFDCRTADGVRTLIRGLADLRAESAATPDDWRYFAESISKSHPITELIRQDPMTMTSTHTDGSTLLDYVYGAGEPNDVSITGRCIGAQTSGIDLVRSLRSRRSILAQRIDEVSMLGNARILVIGAGRFYEGDLSKVVAGGRFEHFVVVDEDAEALKSVDARFGKSGVETVQASVRSLLSRHVEFSGFDMVYAPSLLDSLGDLEARRMTELMFSMVRPGGRLLLVNAGDSLGDTAYRETFLSWTVNGRSENDLVALSSGIPSRLIGQVRLYRDDYGISNFVELFRR